MFKPTVQYEGKVEFYNGFAFVKPIDHYSSDVSNECVVATSAVVKKNEDGSFETENTIYIPKK